MAIPKRRHYVRAGQPATIDHREKVAALFSPMQILSIKSVHSELALLQMRQQIKGRGACSVTSVILRIPNLDSVRQYLETGNPVKDRIWGMSNHRDASLPRDR